MIDASVWVSYFVAADPRHRVAREWVARQLAGEVVLAGPGLVLAEVAGAVARLAGDPAMGRRALDVLLAPGGGGIGLQVDAWEPHEQEEAAALACDLLLRGADAHYVLAARRYSAPLITWDEEQLARAAHLVPMARPDEALSWPKAG